MDIQTSHSQDAEPGVDRVALSGPMEKELGTPGDVEKNISRNTSSTEISNHDRQEKSQGDSSSSQDPEKTTPVAQDSGEEYVYPNDVVAFDSPDDPENPKNFTKRKKWAITISMGWMTFVVTFASSIFSTGIDAVSKEYHIGRVVATLGVSLFLLVRLSLCTSHVLLTVIIGFRIWPYTIWSCFRSIWSSLATIHRLCHLRCISDTSRRGSQCRNNHAWPLLRRLRCQCSSRNRRWRHGRHLGSHPSSIRYCRLRRGRVHWASSRSYRRWLRHRVLPWMALDSVDHSHNDRSLRFHRPALYSRDLSVQDPPTQSSPPPPSHKELGLTRARRRTSP